jgi:transposase-like protein
MSHGKPRDSQKERFWRQAIGRWQKSGLTIRAFCRQHGVAEANFHAWRRTLADRDSAAAAFAPVHVLNDEPLALTGQAAHGALELLLPNRRVLRIGAGFDAATLQRLLPLLEEAPPC